MHVTSCDIRYQRQPLPLAVAFVFNVLFPLPSPTHFAFKIRPRSVRPSLRFICKTVHLDI